MLSKVLSKETCAKCRFCCSFRRCSLWETPLFPKNECEKLSKDNEYGVKSDFQMQGEYGQMKLLHKYCTQDSEEEAACDYLDEHKGCILSQEDKPFDCKKRRQACNSTYTNLSFDRKRAVRGVKRACE